MGLISYIATFGVTHASLKTITRIRTLKGGGFGLTCTHKNWIQSSRNDGKDIEGIAFFKTSSR